MFGPYRLGQLLGQGGMGEVYRAYDTVRDRVVAVKRLPPRLAADAAFQARFRRESELAARLRDAHVVPIHDFGEIDGMLFLDMRLVDGVDLATLLTTHGALSPGRAVDIVSQVAQALDAAHDEGLVHRDVKPSNVLVSRGRGGDFAYLIDFGIAHAAGGTKITMTGQPVGTPAYMAPERFEGGGEERSGDIYALACVLFQALTGRAPFVPPEGTSFAWGFYVNAHLNRPPPAPSTVSATVPPGLDAVVARAMAKLPEDRYARAGDLAADARAAVAELDVPTGPVPVPEPPPRTPRWHRILVAVALVVAVLVGTAVVVGPRLWTAAASSVTARVPIGENPLGLALAPDGRRAYAVDAASGVVAVLDLDRSAVVARWRAGRLPREVVVSPDGARLFVTAAADDALVELDATTGEVLATIPVGRNPVGLAMAPDGRLVTANEFADTVSVVDPAARAVVATVPVGKAPIAVAVSPDGRHAWVTTKLDDEVSVIDTGQARRIDTLHLGLPASGQPLARGLQRVTFTPDGAWAWVVVGESSSIAVVDTRTDRVVGSVELPYFAGATVFSADGRRAFVSSFVSDDLSVVDVATRQIVATATVGGGAVYVRVSRDGRYAYVVSTETHDVAVVDLAPASAWVSRVLTIR